MSLGGYDEEKSRAWLLCKALSWARDKEEEGTRYQFSEGFGRSEVASGMMKCEAGARVGKKQELCDCLDEDLACTAQLRLRCPLSHTICTDLRGKSTHLLFMLLFRFDFM